MIPPSKSTILGLIFGIIVAGFAVVVFFAQDNPPDIVKAGGADNVFGWAWSENIGWISFNCSNESTCDVVDYGVGIDDTTGAFFGYAWSENIGWIKFDPAGPYPSQEENGAELNLNTGEVSGWVRACAGAENPDCTGGTNPSSGGWDGWIKMRNHSSDTGADYGVSVDQNTGEFHGWAWGGDVVGWVSFNCQEGGSSGEDICGQSSYPVITDPALFNVPPQAINLQDNNTAADYCFVSSPPIILSWEFSDLDSQDTQTAYQIQLAINPGFESLLIDTGKVQSTNSEFSPLSLSFSTTYYWRVKVWDSSNEQSVPEWATGAPFTTSHAFPNSNFTFSPTLPSAEEEVTFTDTTTFATGSTSQSWSWDFGDTATSSQQHPVHVYQENGAYTVTLSAGDDAGSCPVQKNVNIALPFPEWQEISPF